MHHSSSSPSYIFSSFCLNWSRSSSLVMKLLTRMFWNNSFWSSVVYDSDVDLLRINWLIEYYDVLFSRGRVVVLRRLSLLSIGSFSKFFTICSRFCSFNLNLWSIMSCSSIPHNLVTLPRIVESSPFPTVSATVLTSYSNLVSLDLTALFKNMDSCFLLILDYWAEI